MNHSIFFLFWCSILLIFACFSEELYDDEQFQWRQLAASVASKVFYHLEELDDSLKYALGAGDLFNINKRNEYVDTLIGI